jgi:hypothetical protein
MYSNAIDLKEFYGTLQGRVVKRILRQHVRNMWGDTRGMRVLGVGFATPYLRPLMTDSGFVSALMPRRQGAVFWPQDAGSDGKGRVALCDEDSWPVETNSVDRLLIVHGLQSYESLDGMLRESWRVLTGQGRLILIVPNRTGVWARFDSTPFGHGAPFSQGQIRKSLRDYLFVPEQSARALFFPPTASRLMLATWGLWEKAGSRFFNALGGVNIVEATKQLYGGHAIPVHAGAGVRQRVVVGTMPSQRARQ